MKCAGHAECGLYHYKVLLFEKAAGRFRQPDEYLRDALATVTTMTCPPYGATGRDATSSCRRLGLYPTLTSKAT